MAMSGAVSSRSDIHFNDQEAWQALTASFLESKGITSSEVKVAVTDDEIIISSMNPNVEAAIRDALSTPDSTRDKLRYILTELTAKAGESVVASPTVEFTGGALELFTRIFSDDVLFACGLSEKILRESDQRDKQTLRISVPAGSVMENLWRSRFEVFIAAMVGAGINNMREAFLKNDRSIGVNPMKIDNIEFINAFKKAIGFESAGNTLTFYFNYAELLNLLFPRPPKVSVSNEDSGWVVRVKKEEALHYLMRTFHEGFMMKREGQEYKLILLPRGNLAKSKNLISLVLDCSGSMEDVFQAYMYYVISFLEKIVSQSKPGDIIRINNFSDQAHTRPFELTGHNEADLDSLKAHLMTLKPAGTTHLYNTIKNELKALDEFTEYVQSVIIFTDGENYVRTDNKPEDPAVARSHADEFLNGYRGMMTTKPAHQVPSIFTMGLGANYNQEVLKAWAQLAGVPHTHLRDINDFKNIFAHLEIMRRPRILVTFVQNILSRFHCSVYEGTLSMPQAISIDPSQPFSVGQKTYRVAGAPQLETAPAAAAAAAVSPRTYTPGYGDKTQTVDEETKEKDVDEVNSWVRNCRIS